MSPNMIIVREKYVPGEPYQALVFGVYNHRKGAVKQRRDLLAQAVPPCAQIELLTLRLGFRYDPGAGASGHHVELQREEA